MSDQTSSLKPTGLKTMRAHLPRGASLRTILALILREMSATYGRSPGGYLWAVLEPAAGLALLVAIFSTGFRSPPLGSNFAIFYASGLLPFLTFLMVTMKVQQALNYSRQLLAYPRVTFMDALIARFVLAVLTQAMVSALILGAILTLSDTRTILDLGRLLNAFAMVSALGFGVGVMNCVLISRHDIWQSVWAVMTRPLILISGVIILHTSIPRPYSDWLLWNPLVHAVGESRRAFYYSYHGDYVAPGYVYLVALICSGMGLLFLRAYYRDLMER